MSDPIVPAPGIIVWQGPVESMGGKLALLHTMGRQQPWSLWQLGADHWEVLRFHRSRAGLAQWAAMTYRLPDLHYTLFFGSTDEFELERVMQG